MNLSSMNIKERAAVVDTTVTVRMERDLKIECIVLDVRSRFGTWDLKLTPVSGQGQQWIHQDRCMEVQA